MSSSRCLLIAVLMVSAVCSTTAMGSLVLWNRLGSAQQVQHSEVGLGGTVTGGQFVPGMFDGAFSADYSQPLQVTFPKEVIPTYAGCIEFWAHAWGFPAQIGCGSYGAFPELVAARDGNTVYEVHLNCNDGASSGGVCGRAGHLFNAGTGYFGSWTYSQVLGAGQEEMWHHYALVWNANGIAGVGDGTRKVAVFLDGVLNSGRWQNAYEQIFTPMTSGSLGLIQIYGGQGRVTVDNLKIWNTAMTDFSHRFQENWPEPATLGLFGVAALLVLRRDRSMNRSRL
jgi:hypothetical protein